MHAHAGDKAVDLLAALARKVDGQALDEAAAAALDGALRALVVAQHGSRRDDVLVCLLPPFVCVNAGE